MHLAFDTETTGLLDFNRSEVDLSHPRLVSLAAILYDGEREVAHLSAIVRPDYGEIPPASSAVHGITTRDANAYGLPLAAVLFAFDSMAALADIVVAHNIRYDLAVVRSELWRLKQNDRLEHLDRFDTMTATTELVGIERPGHPGEFKWPSLAEAYLHLFPDSIDELVEHDALSDARACARIYAELWGRSSVVTTGDAPVPLITT